MGFRCKACRLHVPKRRKWSVENSGTLSAGQNRGAVRTSLRRKSCCRFDFPKRRQWSAGNSGLLVVGTSRRALRTSLRHESCSCVRFSRGNFGRATSDRLRCVPFIRSLSRYRPGNPLANLALRSLRKADKPQPSQLLCFVRPCNFTPRIDPFIKVERKPEVNRPVLLHGSERIKTQASLGDIQHCPAVVSLQLDESKFFRDFPELPAAIKIGVYLAIKIHI